MLTVCLWSGLQAAMKPFLLVMILPVSPTVRSGETAEKCSLETELLLLRRMRELTLFITIHLFSKAATSVLAFQRRVINSTFRAANLMLPVGCASQQIAKQLGHK